MRSTRGSPLPYTPGPVPEELPASARRYLDDELHRIAALLQLMSSGLRLDPSYAPPDKPRRGDIVYTDATTWDPGSGEGYYYFNSNGVWTPLG